MLGNLWRRLFGRRVFFSYRDREPEDAAIAQLIAEGLQRHGIHTILEGQKQDYKGDFSEHLYKLLAQSEGVVSILSPRTQDSQWLFFEALTAKIQKKLHLVALPGTRLSQTFEHEEAIDADAFRQSSTQKSAIAKLARDIKARANGAVVYRGAPGLIGALRRGIAGLIALIIAVLSFIVLFDNARKAICVHTLVEKSCVAAGWPSSR